MITITKYPVLEWDTYHPNFQLEEIKFLDLNQKPIDILAKSKGFQNFFGLLEFDYFQGDTLADKIRKENVLPSIYPHKHFYLSDTLFQKVDSDVSFRNKVWSNRSTLSISGSVMFTQGGFYMFRILNEQDYQTYKNHYSDSASKLTHLAISSGGCYIEVAHFIENKFVGFERCTLSPDNKIDCYTPEYYYHPVNKGTYISFVSIALTAYFTDAVNSKTLNPNEDINHSSQPVIFLD